ncbi:hypothetical protein CYMTET_41065 [Cymbomonas tetramitiformis]|uniref:Uncharacterized protein n=1 Tax=Cymbomonas tetramitiformis TaxID=36881 RepID=A0AAE0C6X0_9CHLO|nr:hypothetical protein CYMTET_41065 [Cymbomonas tetramitiformis]
MDDFLVLVDSKIEALRARELASRTQPDATWVGTRIRGNSSEAADVAPLDPDGSNRHQAPSEWTESEWYRNTVDRFASELSAQISRVGALLARADVFPEVGGPRPSKQSDDPAYVQEPLHSHGAGRFRAVQGLKVGRRYVPHIVSWDLRGNGIRGTVPTEIGTFTKLRDLGFTNTDVTGTLPTEIAKMTRLGNILNFRNDYSERCYMTGQLPTEIGLILKNGWADWRIVGTNFTGTLPTEIGHASTNINWIYLYSNSFVGTLPTELGKLGWGGWLERLYLYDNSLTGTLPTELAALTQLSSMSVSGNSMTGTVPMEMGILTSVDNLRAGGCGLEEHQRGARVLPYMDNFLVLLSSKVEALRAHELTS